MARGLTLVDLLFAIAVLALLVWVVRHDWPPAAGAPPTAVVPAR